MPLVVCFFSYLFSVCVLLGLITRSTLASLLLTMLFWLFIFLLGRADAGLLNAEIWARRGGFPPMGRMGPEGGGSVNPRNPADEEDAATANGENPSRQQPGEKSGASTTAERLALAHKMVYYALTVLPKTTETIALLDAQSARSHRAVVWRTARPSRPVRRRRTGSRGDASHALGVVDRRHVAGL